MIDTSTTQLHLSPETMEGRRQKDFKSQRNQSLLPDCVYQKCEVSTRWLAKHDPSKDNTNRHAAWKGGKLEAPVLDKELETDKEC